MSPLTFTLRLCNEQVIFCSCTGQQATRSNVCGVSRLPQLALIVGVLAGVILLTIAAGGTFLLVRGDEGAAKGTFAAPGDPAAGDAPGASGGDPAGGRPEGSPADPSSALSVLSMPGGSSSGGPGPDASPSGAPGTTGTGSGGSGTGAAAGEQGAGQGARSDSGGGSTPGGPRGGGSGDGSSGTAGAGSGSSGTGGSRAGDQASGRNPSGGGASGRDGAGGGAASGGAVIRLSPPTLVAIAPRPLDEKRLRSVRSLPHVRKTVALGGGAVRVSGVTLNLLAVPVDEFRAWTPVGIADRPEPWEALRRGEFIAEAAAGRRLGLIPGAHYQLDGGPRLRLAASAAIGLPGVDGYVSEETGRRLGLTPGVVVLVHGPATEADAVSRRMRRLLGAGTQVALTGPAAAVRTEMRVAPARPPAKGTFTGRVGRPAGYIELYQRSAALCPGLSWTVLAAIGHVESGHGRNNGPSSAGALGPMQFMPATWKAYGVDGDGDGKADIWSPYDAVPGAANYLCANGAGQGGKKLEKAVWHYNHSWSYVAKVLNLANAYAAAYP